MFQAWPTQHDSKKINSWEMSICFWENRNFMFIHLWVPEVGLRLCAWERRSEHWAPTQKELFIRGTRMHSRRMHNVRSSSHLLGGVCLSACWDTPPGCGPGDPQVRLWRPLGCGPGDHPPPPGVGLETLQARPLNSPPDVGLETCNACWDTTPLWTESQTPVKTWPSRNFVCGR